MVTPDGYEVPLAGSYLEVVENEHLVIGMEIPGRPVPATMSMDLERHGAQTRIVLAQTCDTAEDRDSAEQGSNLLLDWLTTHLAKD